MNKNNTFSKLKNQVINKNEKEGLEKMFKMMLWLRQQIRLRKSFEKEKIKNNIHVYCTNCKNFQMCDDVPHCSFEKLCDIKNCEDSKPFKQRPCYVERIESEISDKDLGKIIKYIFENNGGVFSMEWDSDYEEFFENYITSIEDVIAWYKNKKYV